VFSKEGQGLDSNPRSDLLTIFQAALKRVNGHTAVVRDLAGSVEPGPLALVALGKAAQSMASGAREALGGRIAAAMVISKPGHLDPHWLQQQGWYGLLGDHPLPSVRSLAAGQALAEFLAGLPSDWRLLFLISGGASSLVEIPVPGVELEDIQRTNRWLLGSGLAIGEMNLVRKSLSRIKGGGLLSYLSDRRVEALLISDVPGDDLAAIGSGLLIPDVHLAARVRDLALPDWLRSLVERGLEARGAPSTGEIRARVVASLADARRAAAQRARALGYAAWEHTELRAGDAYREGLELARLLLEGPPGVHVWGGETTVRLPERPGRGGRNQHLALAAATRIAGVTGVCFLAAGTDGTDGPTEDAGALVDGGSLARGRERGLEAEAALTAADAGSFLHASGDLVNTGPTGTNVMDLMLGLKVSEA
jgi:hydroxypyruvate reductase